MEYVLFGIAFRCGARIVAGMTNIIAAIIAAFSFALAGIAGTSAPDPASGMFTPSATLQTSQVESAESHSNVVDMRDDSSRLPNVGERFTANDGETLWTCVGTRTVPELVAGEYVWVWDDGLISEWDDTTANPADDGLTVYATCVTA